MEISEDRGRHFEMFDLIVFLVLAALGFFVWLVSAWMAGVPEAWDAPNFNTISVPIMAGFVAIAAFLRPHGFWLWGVAVMILHPVALLIQPDLGVGVPFVLVGAIAFGVYAFLYTGVAALAAAIKWGIDVFARHWKSMRIPAK